MEKNVNKAAEGSAPRWLGQFAGAVKKKWAGFSEIVTHGNFRVACSMFLMGTGQMMYKQWAKGALYLLIQAGFFAYFILAGAADLFGLFTLGTVEANPWYGIEGDDSVLMLITGILSVIMLILYLALYAANVKGTYEAQKRVEAGKRPFTFLEDFKQLFDQKFYKTVLFLPVLGVSVFSILPIVFMILIAFTNYGGDIVPPRLVDWVGFENFGKLVAVGEYATTFFKIFGWNILWAVLSTGINYFGGLALALLLNKSCVKGKVFWRFFPILAYAIPGFITMLGFKFMFANGGPVNYYITQGGGDAIFFFGANSTWPARFIGLMVNAWISIPSSMLLATGILSNANKDQYEAAKIDGANAFQQFRYLTLPFVVFATTPVILSQFIGNFNNFGVFYFLRSDVAESAGYVLANDTDLLINWLYKMSIDNNYYSIGAAISLIIFLITSVISLVVYIFSPSYRQEETYRGKKAKASKQAAPSVPGSPTFSSSRSPCSFSSRACGSSSRPSRIRARSIRSKGFSPKRSASATIKICSPIRRCITTPNGSGIPCSWRS